MIVENPWEHTALTQQILANLKDSERPGFFEMDMLLAPRHVALLKTQLNMFYALESGEPLQRDLPEKEGG